MSVPTSFELWASSKIVGRECATINKDFFICKSSKGANPSVCEKEANLATSCASKIVDELNGSFPTEFVAFQKCLDYNDYRFGDCRKTEKALLDSWNKKMEYQAN